MAPVSSDLRNKLSRSIEAARSAAESGALGALESLAVHHHEPHGSMTPPERDLRNRLRARGRQLGDVRNKTKGTQTIHRLAHEVAYEQWHRMLFARFLAENHLLIEPESGVAITSAECEDLARERGVDPRTMAAQFAQRSLPQIFRSGDPVLEVALAPETRGKLDELLDSLPAAVFTADDSLGWTYQFWQSAEKDRVNAGVKSGDKITGETLPAVTQLFTEHYMVQFLLDNTIGAWHAGKVLSANPELATVATSEQELRDAVQLPGYEFEYLRFVREAREGEDLNAGTGPWRPAAGTYSGWPTEAAKLRVLDPCCGSGHFLVAGFELLVRLRMAEENLEVSPAIKAVLADNLFGLELDPRCTQIAAFNLALAAWKLAGKPIELPPLHIACSGTGPQSTKDEWLKMAEPELAKERSDVREAMRRGLSHMHELFCDAPELGSLINPNELPAEGFAADFETIKPLLDRILAAESEDDEAHERAVAARGMAAAAEILAGDFTLVITNVPYVTRKIHGPCLADWADRSMPSAKSDLATLFMESFLKRGGRSSTFASVSPQAWTMLARYADFRTDIVKRRQVCSLIRLGEGAFESPLAAGAFVCLSIITSSAPPPGHLMTLLDAAEVPGVRGKSEHIAAAKFGNVIQADQLKNPDSVITFTGATDGELLKEIANAWQGISTSDFPRFGRMLWEIECVSDGWVFQQSTVETTQVWGGRSTVLFWEDGAGVITEVCQENATLRGQTAWGNPGVVVSQMRSLPATLYSGDKFDGNCSVITAADPDHVPAIWAYATSPEFHDGVRRIDISVKVTNNSLVKVPFDLDHWQWVAAEKYPNGLPEPQSDDPTQWLFHGRPERAEPHMALQVGVARLLRYRWPAELDEDMRLAPEARELVKRCVELADHADEDGIVCLPAIRGESSAADRLRGLLVKAFGESWTAGTERELLKSAAEANKGAPAPNLDTWLREKFFEAHCKLFHHRPFVWHVWDGQKNGFHALVNAHKLTGPEGAGRQTLETLTYAYLGDWIKKQKQGVADGKEGADALLAAAMTLQGELTKILDGEPPYDLFVRWKPLHEQAIGWQPDINDGVRLNIRPFLSAKDVGKKHAGVLRWKPNIKWTKDRGKEPAKLRPRADFPWFWGWDEKAKDFAGTPSFDGARWNDLHYTTEAKRAASEARET